MNLYEASKQWASRPADERFWDLPELAEATCRYRDSAREARVSYRSLAVVAAHGEDGNLRLVGPTGTPAVLTHWAFGQLCRAAGAPADYLRRMDPARAAANLTADLSSRAPGEASLLLHANGSLVCRSATTDSYSRIWDTDVADRLIPFTASGWRVPPARPARGDDPRARPATEEDCRVSTLVRPGELIAPAGLYASDHDLFAFLVNPERRIQDGTPEGLSRGFFLSNSEVGAGALHVVTFLYRHTCGNHIVWGARDVQRLRIVHRGEADARFARELTLEVSRYAEASAQTDEETIRRAQSLSLGKDRGAVLDALFTYLRGEAPRKLLGDGFDRAEGAREHALDSADPCTVWGMAQGLTRHSQSLPHQDARDKVDRLAGRILQMAF